MSEQEAFDKPVVPDQVGTSIALTGDGGAIIERTQDVEPILDFCKEAAADSRYRTPSGDHHAAEFPMVLVETYMNTKGITFEEFMRNPDHIKNMMADPALSHFKIAANVVHKTFR